MHQRHICRSIILSVTPQPNPPLEEDFDIFIMIAKGFDIG
jgi:hypothetical protein